MISGRTPARRRLALAIGVGGALVAATLAAAGGGVADVPPEAVPEAECGPGSLPETSIQGRVPKSDYQSGRTTQGYRCNTELVSRVGNSGGYKVLRYTDSQGQTCAFYDSSLFFGVNVLGNLLNGTGLGVVVLDMSDPAHPRKTANLITPAMLSPHESLLLNEERGLLTAVMGTPATAPGVLDVYDVKADCRHPKLMSTTPSAGFGHESGLSPDGRTFWSAGAASATLTAVDLTDPRRPRRIFSQGGLSFHGLRFSDDGDAMYVANLGNPFGGGGTAGEAGLRIYDVSEVHARKPGAQIHLLSDLQWPEASIPQAAQPFTRDGHEYVLEIDEFSDLFGDGRFRLDGSVGAARIINVDDPRRPYVVSHLRLQVHQPENRTSELMNDPGARQAVRGYTAHYCSVPTRDEPRIAGCSMVLSGLRLFDISDLEHPREVAYYNVPRKSGSFAMSQPAWDAANGSVWYADGFSGFHNVRLTNGVADLLQ